MNQAVKDHTMMAAELTGMEPEQLSLAQVHFHALRVADPSDPERMYHMSQLLSAASTTADFIAPRPDDPDDGDEEDEEDDDIIPPAPIVDSTPPPSPTAKNMQFVRDLIESAKKMVGKEKV